MDDKVWETMGICCSLCEWLAFIIRDPTKFVKDLKNYKHTLKGTGSISSHLGCGFLWDEDGTLCMIPRKFIEKIIDDYKNMFNEKLPGNFKSPFKKGRPSRTW